MKLTTKLLIVASFAVVALSFAASPAAAAGEEIDCLNSPHEFCEEDLSEFAFSDGCSDCYDCPLCGTGSLSSDVFQFDSQATRVLV
jgi:hypothetical protein